MGANNLQVDKENLTVSMERVFNAPVEQVWKAHSDPTMIPKWWGDTTVDKMDFTEGGEWRYLSKNLNGQEMAFFGVYKEIKENELITWTFNFEPYGSDHPIVETITFEDLGDGKTKLKTSSHFERLEDLEGMVAHGMEEGATETWNKLENLLQTMK